MLTVPNKKAKLDHKQDFEIYKVWVDVLKKKMNEMARIIVGHKLNMETVSSEFEIWRQQKVIIPTEDEKKVTLNPIPKKTNKSQPEVILTVTNMIIKYIDLKKDHFYELFRNQIEEEIKKVQEMKQIQNYTNNISNKSPSEDAPNQNLLNFTKTFINQLNNNLSTPNNQELLIPKNIKNMDFINNPIFKDDENIEETEFSINVSFSPDIKWSSFKSIVANSIEDSVENKDINILEDFTKNLKSDILKCSDYVNTLKQALDQIDKCKEKINKKIDEKIKEDEEKSDKIFQKYLN